MKTEFRRLERRRGRSGKDSIDHPPRGSDDIANAVAGVISVAAQYGGNAIEQLIEMNEDAPERQMSSWNMRNDGLFGDSEGPGRAKYDW
jgi:hypothetical protein